MSSIKIKEAEKNTNTNPTTSQKKAGNYKKGKVVLKGLTITIENPKGSVRSGTDKNGDSWDSYMTCTYGYFNSTTGKDGDPIDVFIGPSVEDEFDVYIIDQVDELTRAFDEHKVMFGFKNQEDAYASYMSCYGAGWKGFQNITTISLNKFKKWIKNKDAIKYPAKKLNMSSKLDFKNKTDTGMIKTIQLFGEVIEGKTLNDLKKQTGEIKALEQLVIKIASPGGSVSEGLEIMVWLDYLSQQGIKVVTIVVANAYSIASLIMLAADIRLISVHGKVMVHNPMVPELQYVNANDLEEYVESLRGLEQMMYDLYRSFTELETEQIKMLMDNETYLSPQDAVTYGFADLVVEVKPRSYEMATNIKREVNMSKTLNIINKVIALVNQSDFINQLYYDQIGNEIEIFQNDPSGYKIGDRTSIETSGEDGIKLSDGSMLIIEDYVIKDIIKFSEEAPEDMPSEQEAQFNEGPPPVEDVIEKSAIPDPVEAPVKGKDEMPSAVIETTESTKTTKETVASDVEISEKGDMKAKSDEEIAKAIKEAEVKVEEAEAKVKEAEAKYDEINKKIEAIGKKMDEKFEGISKFEEATARAIDTLAENTVSHFKPEAKSTAPVNEGGSIFQRAKKAAGL